MIVTDLEPVWRFVHERTGVAMSTSMKAIGQATAGGIVAGVLYEKWTDANVWMHIAIAPGTMVSPRWARLAFAYPFDQVGRRRITCDVDADNAECRRLVERIGFQREAVLAGAGAAGVDQIIYRLRREDCRLLRRDASMAGCRAAEGTTS